MRITKTALLILLLCTSFLMGFTVEEQRFIESKKGIIITNEIDYLAPFPARAGQEDMNYIIVVDKHSRVLYLLHSNKTFWAIVRTFPVAIGKNNGQKQQRGDLKTPEGIYFIINRKEDRELPSKYGPLSYVLNYPNRIDRKASRSGGGIWLHGTDPGAVPVDTRGCLELHNNNLLKLSSIINRGTMVPVIITGDSTCNLKEVVNLEAIWKERQFLIAGEEGEKKKLGPEMVAQWSSLSFVEGRDRRDTIFQRDTLYMVDTVQVKEPYVQRDTIVKRDTVHRQLTDTIVKRDTIHQKLTDTIIQKKTIVKQFPVTVFDTVAHEKAIYTLIDKWEKDWESRDVERYGSNYAISLFKSGELRWKRWIHEKKRNFADYTSINITVIQPEIFNLTDSSAIVEFNQIYKSDFFTVKNGKRLSLIWGESGWKIRREETIAQKKL